MDPATELAATQRTSTLEPSRWDVPAKQIRTQVRERLSYSLRELPASSSRLGKTAGARQPDHHRRRCRFGCIRASPGRSQSVVLAADGLHQPSTALVSVGGRSRLFRLVDAINLIAEVRERVAHLNGNVARSDRTETDRHGRKTRGDASGAGGSRSCSRVGPSDTVVVRLQAESARTEDVVLAVGRGMTHAVYPRATMNTPLARLSI